MTTYAQLPEITSKQLIASIWQQVCKQPITLEVDMLIWTSGI